MTSYKEQVRATYRRFIRAHPSHKHTRVERTIDILIKLDYRSYDRRFPAVDKAWAMAMRLREPTIYLADKLPMSEQEVEQALERFGYDPQEMSRKFAEIARAALNETSKLALDN